MATVERFEKPGIQGWIHRPDKINATMLLSHGAGGNCQAPLMVSVADAFAKAEYCVLRWDLPFRQLRPRGAPGGSGERDREGIVQAAQELRKIAKGVPLYLAGQSYGGRQSSMVGAEDSKVADGLLLLSYPLHPPGKPAQLRTEHFPKLHVPTLFVHGTRDPFGSVEELRDAIKLIQATARLQVVDGAGHGVPPRHRYLHAGMAFRMINTTLRERIDQVEDRIQTAAQRCGRARDSITLIAVTKKFAPEVICEAYSLGLRLFGENYVQEFAEKLPAVRGLADAQYHLIGHLQSNKARLAAESFQVVETVDSEKLARRLNESGKPLEVMIEVKLSEEGSKAGAAPEELPGLIAAIRACPNLQLTGLMTMPPWNPDPETTRPYFRKLAELARLHQLPKLSMGMSHDLEAAIEEGATHIRVGTALFGPRPKASE